MITILVGSLTGLLIGMVGVGGILLAPLLVAFSGINLHLAMATSSFSFLFTGVSGTLTYARRGSISWRLAGCLCLGIIPAAILGARVNVLMRTQTLAILLAILIVFSGLQTLLMKPGMPSAGSSIEWWKLSLIGVAVGFGSALTGTGGPVLLLPILVFLKMPVLAAVGVSQVVQLPIAGFASIGFSLFGEIDLGLGMLLGVIQAIAVLLGARIAHKLPADRLRQLVALALIAAGIIIIIRSLLSM